MGRQIVHPATFLDQLAVVEALSKRLYQAVGDWRKHGEGAKELLALALVASLGPHTLRAVLDRLLIEDAPRVRKAAEERRRKTEKALREKYQKMTPQERLAEQDRMRAQGLGVGQRFDAPQQP